MDNRSVELIAFGVVFVVISLGVVTSSVRTNKGSIELFHEITNLVEYIGGPLDGQLGHPYDQGKYMFRRSQDPERNQQNIGALYQKIEGTKAPVKYKFCGYGKKQYFAETTISEI